MNLNYTAEELAFRDEVRAFLDEKLPADIAAKVKGFRRLSKQDINAGKRFSAKRAGTPPTGQKFMAALTGVLSRNTFGMKSLPVTEHRARCPSVSTWWRR